MTLRRKAAIELTVFLLYATLLGAGLGYVIGEHRIPSESNINCRFGKVQDQIDSLLVWQASDHAIFHRLDRQVSTLQTEWNAEGVTNPVRIAKRAKTTPKEKP